MERRDFLRHSAILGTGLMVPNYAMAWSWKETKKTIEVAFWASKLNPVRLIAGLIFDEIAEVFIEPMVKSAFNRFVAGFAVSSSSISYSHSNDIYSNKIEHEPYKASLVVYGQRDYEIEQERKRVIVELTKQLDKDRFNKIVQYLKDEKSKIKLYDRDTTTYVGNYLTPNDLLNIDYISYGNSAKVEVNIKNLLEITNNSSFKKVVE